MYRVGRYVENFDTSDPITRAIALGALAILMVAILPRIWPAPLSEIPCNNLSVPVLGGDHQSLLAAQQPAEQLVLDMFLDKQVLTLGDSLNITVRMVNRSMAPFTLYFEESKIPFRYSGREAGLQFFIQQMTPGPNGDIPGATKGDNVPPVSPLQQFRVDQLRVLGPRQRCRVYLEITPQRLAQAQMSAGRYRIIAIYGNVSKGVVPPVAALTPTPIFTDQGVWVGEVRSNEVILTVLAPGQPTPKS